jgi:hypothetical protein
MVAERRFKQQESQEITMSHTSRLAEDEGLSISTQYHFLSGDQTARDLRAMERVLNSAIIAADITQGWEEYLEIVNAFYADDVEVSGETGKEVVRGKAGVRKLLFNFLFPLHVAAEIGGLSVKIRQNPIHGDTADETHSAWSMSLIAPSGVTCNLAWSTLRRWAGSRVVYEHHYDHQQTGGPLTEVDLRLSGSPVVFGDRRPS